MSESILTLRFTNFLETYNINGILELLVFYEKGDSWTPSWLQVTSRFNWASIPTTRLQSVFLSLEHDFA
jgi:hypothetical protein